MNQKIYVHHQPQILIPHYSIVRVTQLDILPDGHILNLNALKGRGTQVNINLDKIIYITTYNKYKHNNTLIRMDGPGNHCLIVRDTLLHLENKLNPDIYVRSHYSYIVNINFVDWFLPPNRLFIANYELPVGKNYVSNLKDKLFPPNNYIANH